MKNSNVTAAATSILLLCLSLSASDASVQTKAAGTGCNLLGDTVIADGELYYSHARSGPYERQSTEALKASGKLVHFVYVAGPIGKPKRGAILIRHRKHVDASRGHGNYAKMVYLRRSPMTSDMRIGLSSFRRYHENGAGSRALARHFHFTYRSGGRGNARTDDTPLKLNSAKLQATEQPSETTITKRLMIPFTQHPLASCIAFNLAVGNAERTGVAVERVDAYDLEHLPVQDEDARKVIRLNIEATESESVGSEMNNSASDPQ